MTKTRLTIHFRIDYPKFEYHEAFSLGVHPKNCFAKNIYISASIPEKLDEFVNAVSRFSEANQMSALSVAGRPLYFSPQFASLS